MDIDRDRYFVEVLKLRDASIIPEHSQPQGADLGSPEVRVIRHRLIVVDMCVIFEALKDRRRIPPTAFEENSRISVPFFEE